MYISYFQNNVYEAAVSITDTVNKSFKTINTRTVFKVIDWSTVYPIPQLLKGQ